MYENLKILVPFIIYIAAIILNIYQVGIFKNKLAFFIVCGVAAFFMPIYIGLLLIITLLVVVVIKNIYEENRISNFKEYIRDNSIHGYHLIFRLISGEVITRTTDLEEFTKIKNWCENEDKINYPLNDDKNNRYFNLTKTNLVEFSYNTITNKKNILNPIEYIFTLPAPKMFNILNYVKGLLLAPIILCIFIIYEKYMFNADIRNLISNITMINRILFSVICLVSMIFILAYLILFGLHINEMTNAGIDYYYKVKVQKMEKFYNYASANIVFIGFIFFALPLCRLY